VSGWSNLHIKVPSTRFMRIKQIVKKTNSRNNEVSFGSSALKFALFPKHIVI